MSDLGAAAPSRVRTRGEAREASQFWWVYLLLGAGWLLQLYDNHNTRIEVMVRKPVQKPCCSENLDPYIK